MVLCLVIIKYVGMKSVDVPFFYLQHSHIVVRAKYQKK